MGQVGQVGHGNSTALVIALWEWRCAKWRKDWHLWGFDPRKNVLQ